MLSLHEIFRKGLVKNVAIYTLTDGVAKAMSFLLLPFISYYIIPSEMGIVANFDVLQSIIILIAGQAIVNALPYFYYGRSHEDVALLVSSLVYIILIVNALFLILILCFSSVIWDYLHLTLSLQLLTIVTVLANLLISIDMVLYRLEDKPRSFAKLQLTQTFLNVFFVVCLVMVWHLEALGKIYATVLSVTGMGVLHFMLLKRRRYLVLCWDKAKIKTLLNFGVPLLPHSLSFWLKSGMDKVLLTTFCGLAANGIYSMAMSFGAVYSVFNTAFNNAYIPYLQKRIANMTEDNQSAEKQHIVCMTYKLTVFFMLLYFVAVLCAWVMIHYVLDEKYKLSFEYVPWIMLSLTVNAVYGLMIQFVYTVKKTFGLGIITFSGSLIQLALTYLFIRLYGADGVKYSLVIGSLIIMFGVWWYSNRVYPLPWFKRM